MRAPQGLLRTRRSRSPRRNQWLRGGKAIKGATKASYKLTAKDRGGRLSVRVTASKPGYQSAKLVTKASAKVKAAKKKSAKK